jgi:hypothetical protein
MTAGSRDPVGPAGERRVVPTLSGGVDVAVSPSANAELICGAQGDQHDDGAWCSISASGRERCARGEQQSCSTPDGLP